MCIRLAILALAVAGQFLVGCVSSEQSTEPLDADAAVIARLLEEAAALRDEGNHQLSWASVALALRINPEHAVAKERWGEAEQDRSQQVQQLLREARELQLDRRYTDTLRVLERANAIDPGNPAVEALADIISDVLAAQVPRRPSAQEGATTESGYGMRWVWEDNSITSAEELTSAIQQTIQPQRILAYCQSQPADSIRDPIRVTGTSMPIFLRDDDAVIRGKLFEEDDSLGEIHWYAFSCGSVHFQAMWAFVVWRDDGDDRWVLQRGLIRYDSAKPPVEYAGAEQVGDDSDRYDDVPVIPGD